MKKLISVIIILTLLFTFASCSGSVPATNNTTVKQENAPEINANSDCFPSITDSMEYTLYQNIFFNDSGKEYEGKEITKTGTYSKIYDAYNGKTRYYCWGYYDNTKCCDWQWEFVPKDENSLPPVGSLIEMTGTFTKSEEALDGYWFTNASVSLKQEFKGPDCDYDLTSMSATLERVQIQNMQYKPEEFAGKTVSEYGRVKTDSSVQHPYYDDVWEQTVVLSDNSVLPAIGTYVIITGTFNNGTVTDATYSETTDY